MIITNKKLPLLKNVKNNIKKTVTMNSECNYVVAKFNNITGLLIESTILNSDLFDIHQVIEYFTNY
jgi:hypothetical protein